MPVAKGENPGPIVEEPELVSRDVQGGTHAYRQHVDILASADGSPRFPAW